MAKKTKTGQTGQRKIDAIKNLGVKELEARLAEVRRETFEAKMKLATGQLENTSSLWKMRKEIARIKTFMGQKAEQKA